MGDFPTPEELAKLDDWVLAKHCNLGCRPKRIIMLARSIVEGKVCLQNLEEICKMTIAGLAAAEEVIQCMFGRLNKELSALFGFG
jgi:3-methyladenine DNA glycosylase/8-oxoguanine DNA glycosylase